MLTKGGGTPTPQAAGLQGLVASAHAPLGAWRRMARYPAHVRFFLGITGASGAPYAARVLAGLTAAGAEVGVCASRAAGEVIAYELYRDRSLDPGRGGASAWSTSTAAPQTTLYAEDDWFSPYASGSAQGRRLPDLPLLDGDGRARSRRPGSPT